MKKYLYLISLLIVFLSPAFVRAAVLSDIDGHMYQEAILHLQNEGIVEGYPDGTYQPNRNIGRDEFTKIVVGAKLEGEPQSYSRSCFPDVPSGVWFEKWVCYAKDNGIVDGYDWGSFVPAGKINLAESAKIVVETFNVPLPQVGSGTEWYEVYLGALQQKNYLPATLTAPDQLMDRGNMAELIYRVTQNITDRPTTNFSITPASVPSQPMPVEPDGGIGDGAEPIPVQPSEEEDLVLDGFFPLGPFSQPVENFQQWIDRGSNTLYEYPMGTDVVAWDIAADNAGLFRLRRPSGDPARDSLEDWGLANIDEPDITVNDWACGGYEGACTDAAMGLTDQWNTDFPEKQEWMNLAGPNVWLSSQHDYCNGPGDEGGNLDCYPNLIEGVDFVGMDIYPISGWIPYEADRNRVGLVGDVLDKLRGWFSPGQETFAIIETSGQKLGGEGTGNRGPTAAEVRAMMWNAINHGARGIFFFSTAFNPFVFDATPADVAAEITTQNAIITALAPVLQGEINPPSVSVAAPNAIDVGWRVSGGMTYVITVNVTNAPVNNATLNLTGVSDGNAEVYNEGRSVGVTGGTITDSFAPYALHIYVVPSS